MYVFRKSNLAVSENRMHPCDMGSYVDAFLQNANRMRADTRVYKRPHVQPKREALYPRRPGGDPYLGRAHRGVCLSLTNLAWTSMRNASRRERQVVGQSRARFAKRCAVLSLSLSPRRPKVWISSHRRTRVLPVGGNRQTESLGLGTLKADCPK